MRLNRHSWGLCVLFSTILAFASCSRERTQLPNILWITSEDNSALLGCYGDPLATTPNLDRLASEGFLYAHAYANCPVCAPTRNTIITGVYAASNGNEQMRSTYALSSHVGTYAALLRQAGYYCTNNSKTDYNTPSIDPAVIWDESSRDAHYRNRPEGKPFFAVFNLLTSHEGSIHPSEEGGMAPGEGYVLRHDPARVELPPYHPDVPAIRHDWALYYDKVEDMDAQVGNLLRELEEEGLAENTIVFYYSDHGGVLARSKRFLHETGTRVPFLVRIPESFKDLYPAAAPGDRVGRLISFVDLAPTLLSLAGEEIPVWMQGDAFLGVRTATAPTYVHLTRGRMDERIDMSRGVTDGRFRYIRNYMPYRISLPHLAYLFKAPSAQAWEDHFRAGLCDDLQSAPFLPKPVEELYDTRADPWEIHNLAGDPAHRDILDRMRAENRRWMAEVRDVGLIPETDYRYFSGDSAMYDYMRSPACPLDVLVEAAEMATLPDGDPQACLNALTHAHPSVRFWGVSGFRIHPLLVDAHREALALACTDPSSSVAILAAECLYLSGDKETALKAYLRVLRDPDYGMLDRNFALNSMDACDVDDPDLRLVIQRFYEENNTETAQQDKFNRFDFLMAENLLKKWDLL